ncbi:hypothetical protein PMAYCL1PPCAC_15640, partial [Pristionchus mayeri]
TFVASIFVYIPYFCVGNFPFLGWPDYHLSELCTVLTSCFPTWDAIVIICLMKAYREGLISIFFCRNPSVAIASSVWQSSSMANSGSKQSTIRA